jgi:Zn-dependent protease with chaperone function
MDSTSPGSSAVSDSAASIAAAPANSRDRPAIYFDGTSSRRHTVQVRFSDGLDIIEDGAALASWPYDDLRAVDNGKGALRLKCTSSLPLARLEVFDPPTQAEIRTRTRYLENDRGGGHAHTGRIVAWSLAAIVSIFVVVVYGMPLVAERLTPLIPLSFDRHLGAMADNQVKMIFGGRACTNAQGREAFSKLVETVRQASHLDLPLQVEVLTSPVPNAFALPGGKIYLLNGLLQKAQSADELAGVLAHEMGHISHRDHTRMMIQRGGVSFLIGLLWGDITGSTAVIFVTRSLFEVSYSREAEENRTCGPASYARAQWTPAVGRTVTPVEKPDAGNQHVRADAFAIEAMHALGRSPAPMGELLFRITGAEGSRTIGILASHPLTEDRRELMRHEDHPATGPEILSDDEWQALKTICRPASAR